MPSGPCNAKSPWSPPPPAPLHPSRAPARPNTFRPQPAREAVRHNQPLPLPANLRPLQRFGSALSQRELPPEPHLPYLRYPVQHMSCEEIIYRPQVRIVTSTSPRLERAQHKLLQSFDELRGSGWPARARVDRGILGATREWVQKNRSSSSVSCLGLRPRDKRSLRSCVARSIK